MRMLSAETGMALGSPAYALSDLPFLDQAASDPHRDRLSRLRRDDADQRMSGRSRIGGANLTGEVATGPRGARLEAERADQTSPTGADRMRQKGDASRSQTDPNGTRSNEPDLAGKTGPRQLTPVADERAPSVSTSKPAIQAVPEGHTRANQEASHAVQQKVSRLEAHRNATTQQPVPGRAVSRSEPSVSTSTGRDSGDSVRGREGTKVSAGQQSGGSEGRTGSQTTSNDSGSQNRLMEEASDSSKPGKVVSASRRSGSSPSSQEAMFERIARAVDGRIGKGESVARILLDPPSLGHVRVEVRMRKDQVQLRLVTETAEARRVLTSRIGELRAALEQQGLHVQRVEFAAPPVHEMTAERDAGESPRAPGQGSDSTTTDGGSEQAYENPAASGGPTFGEVDSGVSDIADETDEGAQRSRLQDVTADCRLDVRA